MAKNKRVIGGTGPRVKWSRGSIYCKKKKKQCIYILLIVRVENSPGYKGIFCANIAIVVWIVFSSVFFDAESI